MTQCRLCTEIPFSYSSIVLITNRLHHLPFADAIYSSGEGRGAIGVDCNKNLEGARQVSIPRLTFIPARAEWMVRLHSNALIEASKSIEILMWPVSTSITLITPDGTANARVIIALYGHASETTGHLQLLSAVAWT